MSQTGDSGRSAERRMKMMEGRRVIKGSRWTGITREATRPYLNIIVMSTGILNISFRNKILIISKDIPIIISISSRSSISNSTPSTERVLLDLTSIRCWR